MGFFKTALDSVAYSIACLCLVFVFALLLGLESIVSGLFTWVGFLSLVFVVFGTIAE
jgi:hypothetical protein